MVAERSRRLVSRPTFHFLINIRDTLVKVPVEFYLVGTLYYNIFMCVDGVPVVHKINRPTLYHLK